MPRKPKPAPDAPRKSKYPGVYPSGKTSWKFMSAVQEHDPVTGATKRKPVSRGGFRTETEAWQAKCAFEAERDGLTATVGADVTVEKWVKLWIDSRLKARDSTTQGRRMALRLYIAPHIGNIPLRQLTKTHVESWVRTLLATPTIRYVDAERTQRGTLAPGTVVNAYNLLSAAMSAAADDGYIQRNPTKRVSLPVVPPHAEIGWTDEHARTFIAALKGNDLEALWLLALLAFMRSGELIALRRDLVDVSKCTIGIQETASRGLQHQPVINPAKSRHSIAIITTPQACMDALQRHFERQRFEYRLTPHLLPDLVFPGNSAIGTLSNQMLNYRLRGLCRELELPHVTVHDLRHVGATLAIRAGGDPAVVSRMLRHHSVAFTLDTYVETSLDDMRRANSALATYLALDA